VPLHKKADSNESETNIVQAFTINTGGKPKIKFKVTPTGLEMVAYAEGMMQISYIYTKSPRQVQAQLEPLW
jgi:hypothetical protein